MLFTRCPDCDTTFRVTDEALQKAHGQVRCGRCASVFNAYAELHEGDAPRAAAEAPQGSTVPSTSPPSAVLAAVPSTPPAAAAPPASAAADAAAASIGAASVADVVNEIETGITEASATIGELAAVRAADEHAISAEEVDDVLTTSSDGASAHAPPWTLGTMADSRPPSRWWAVGALIALLALGLQTVNHFRAPLAGHAVVGPWVQQAYAALGQTVTPQWDVHQYEILDWVATAEPNARGLGSLTITARIQNRGPQRQPYPAVRLRLKDRWEAAVGSRTFTAAEYLPSDTPRGRLMTAGETTRAEIEVVDPGPDAYGFELDVCIEIEAGVLSCGTDEVFL